MTFSLGFLCTFTIFIDNETYCIILRHSLIIRSLLWLPWILTGHKGTCVVIHPFNILYLFLTCNSNHHDVFMLSRLKADPEKGYMTYPIFSPAVFQQVQKPWRYMIFHQGESVGNVYSHKGHVLWLMVCVSAFPTCVLVVGYIVIFRDLFTSLLISLMWIRH